MNGILNCKNRGLSPFFAFFRSPFFTFFRTEAMSPYSNGTAFRHNIPMSERHPSPSASRLLQLLILLATLVWAPHASAVTYANTATTFSWIDAGTHTQVGYNTAPYKFNGGGGCGTTPPTIDDTLSDNIPLGFTFMYGGQNFTQARIMSNGRLQFNNNTTCGFGGPVTQLPYPNANLDYTMRIYGNDLDPTAKSDVPAYNTTCINRASCNVSYATLGTAPYRSFVVTWNNVPEWASGGSTSGNYNLQIILQENGEFIFQYGANTPGPGNATAQVGWQVNNTTDYDVPSVGYPASNSAIKFYIPRPVAEYRMEQLSWNGTPGEVYDTSGNGRHGVRVGSAQTTAGGKVCRGADIPTNADTTISAIDTDINIPTTVGGVGTITFWLAPNAWTGAGIQSNQLFDASITNNEWFFLTKRRIDNSNARLRFTVRDSAGTTRTVETGNLTSAVLSGGWVHIAATWNFNALAGPNQDRLRIYVNGASSATSAFTTAGTMSPGIGTLYVGDNRSTFIEASGTGRSANGVIDEFRIYNYEGGVALVQRDMNQTGACLDHYAVSHAGSGQACQANNVTVTAHDAAHGTIVMPNNTTQIQLLTSTGQGDWALVSGYGALDNGTAGDGIATYLWNGEYQAVFALTHPAAGTVNINVSDGQKTESSGEDPDLVLSACFANFNACHDYTATQCSAATGKLFTRLSGVNSSYDVVALDGGDNVATTFTARAVISLIARANTGAVDAQNCFVPDYTQVLDNAATNFTAGRLTLNNIAVANAYRDARIKVVCDATNCPPVGMTWCSVDNFAIRPQSFTVTSTNANADATGTSPTNPPAIKAGTAFNLTATAVAGYGGTPQIDNAQVAAHAGAIGAGTVSGAFGAADSATGVATGAAFGYSEVGYFRLNATGVYDGSFTSVDQASDCTNDFSNTAVGGKFGCKFGNTSATSYFGRFIPDHFDTTVANACAAGGFTYSGQPFPLTATAENLAGNATTNYTGGFAKTVTLSDANGAAGAFNPATLAAGDFTNGVADHTTTPSVSFKFTNPLTAPATIRVRGTDNEATSADGTEGTSAIRSGRAKLGNAHGSELLALPIPFRTEYWNNGWVSNPADSCSGDGLSGGAVSVTLSASPVTCVQDSGIGLGLSGAGCAAAGPLAQQFTEGGVAGFAGNFNLWLKAPGVNNTGAVTVTGSVPAWLQYPWGGGAAIDPSSRATFGVYKGANEFIYMRENY
ncbi:MAG: LamG domain-containing protein [Gallionella sp.]|nr:LamG domain-containing protein [Gallionella sp.]